MHTPVRARGDARRTLRLAAGVAAAFVLLTGAACGGDDAESSTEGVTLSFYAWSSSTAEDAALRKAIDEYNAGHANKVNLNILPEYDTALQTALAGGSPPDVVYLNDNKLPDMAKANALEPIGDQIADGGDFYPRLREAFTYDGKFYCPPKDFSTLSSSTTPRSSPRPACNLRRLGMSSPTPPSA